jgi:hypothetical protein
MYEPAMVPPPRPRRTGRTVLIVVGVVLGLCCLGGLGAGLWFLNTVRTSLPQVRSATTTYLDDLRAGDTTAAYGLVCDSVRGHVSQESFTAGMNPRLANYQITGISINNVNGHTRARVSTRLTLVDGSQIDHVFPLVKEHGSWRVCE